MFRTILMAAAMTLPAVAGAQQPAPQAPAAPQQAAPSAADVDPTSLVRAALQVIQVVDRNQLGQLYDDASATAKRAVTREAFMNNVAAARQPLGAPASRVWWSVTRQVVPAGGQAPAGNYMSVRFATQFSGGRTMAELVSFRLDEDGTWRLAGYVVQ
ncbi:MAG: DUF4019 domain-containing protein [Pseudoxanthomonas suwonensis]|nr:DUF4019 domain-containing protein [Pseudoxanthomonas suwonensis]